MQEGVPAFETGIDDGKHSMTWWVAATSVVEAGWLLEAAHMSAWSHRWTSSMDILCNGTWVPAAGGAGRMAWFRAQLGSQQALCAEMMWAFGCLRTRAARCAVPLPSRNLPGSRHTPTVRRRCAANPVVQ